MNIEFLKRKEFILFFIVILLGLFLRGGYLDDNYLSQDEASLVLGAKGMVSSNQETGVMQNIWSWTSGRLDGSPFFTLFFKLWVLVVGVNEYLLKLFPLLFGILSIWAIYKTGELIYNREVGLSSAAFLSILPIAIVYSVKLESLTFLLFLFLSSVYYFFRYSLDGKLSSFVLYNIISLVFCLVFPYSFIYILFLLILYFLLNHNSKGIDSLIANPDSSLKYLGDSRILISNLVLLVISLFASFKLYVFESSITFSEGMYFSDSLVSLFYTYKVLFGNIFSLFFVILLFVLFVVLAYVNKMKFFDSKKEKFFSILLLVLSILTSFVVFLIQLLLDSLRIPYFVYHLEYMLVFLIPLIMLFAYFLNRFVINRKTYVMILVLLYVVLLNGLLFPSFIDEVQFHDKDSDLITGYDDSDIIVVSKYSKLAFSLGYYYANDCFSNDISYHRTADYLDCVREKGIYAFQVNNTESGIRYVEYYGTESDSFFEILSENEKVVLMNKKEFIPDRYILGTATEIRPLSATYYHEGYDEYHFN